MFGSQSMFVIIIVFESICGVAVISRPDKPAYLRFSIPGIVKLIYEFSVTCLALGVLILVPELFIVNYP